LGITRVLTDSLGVVTDSYSYDAYGTLTASTGTTANSYLYAGEQFDKGLNQYYLRDRYYGTDIGGFTQMDRFDGDMMQPLSLNRYGYTHGNPVNAIDPSGMFSLLGSFSDFGAEASYRRLEMAQVTSFFARVASVAGTAGKSGANSLNSKIALLFVAGYLLTLAIEAALEELKKARIPTVVYGGDLSETREHIFKALTSQGYTSDNPTGSIFGFNGSSKIISPILQRIGDEDPKNTRGWYNSREQCKDRTGGTTGKVCDEYPYFSTKEGGLGNYKNGLVSIHPVIATEQTSGDKTQAVLLNKFYSAKYGNVPKKFIFANLVDFGNSKSYGFNKDGERFEFW
jgi:RHS repeat-associated protein